MISGDDLSQTKTLSPEEVSRIQEGAADYADRRNMKKLMFSIEIIRRKNPNTEELEAICGALARSQSGTGKM